MNKCTINAILRKDKINKKTGLAPVALQAFINGSRKVIALNIYINPKFWDDMKRKVTGGPEMKSYNLVIEQSLARANKIFVDYHLMELELTPDDFMNQFTGKENRNDFIQFYERELERRHKLEIISKTTYIGQRSTFRKLQNFKSQIMFSELTADFIEKFCSWHKKYLAKQATSNGKELVMGGFNTIEKAKAHLRTYILLAIKRKGIRIANPFEEVKVKQVQGIRSFLEREELLRLMELMDDEKLSLTHKLTLARFLFACFASIRISDTQRLDEIKMINQHIEFVPEKTRHTGKRLTIPLNQTAQRYYSYLAAMDFQGISDQEMNRSLKDLARMAKINKHITFHVARHTFATQFIANGGDVTVLQQILGHADIRATMVYVHMARNVQQLQVMMLDKISNA
jgi:site-specific recombinase XerD